MNNQDKRQLIYEIFSNMRITGSVPTHLEPLQQIAGVKSAGTRKDRCIDMLIACSSNEPIRFIIHTERLKHHAYPF